MEPVYQLFRKNLYIYICRFGIVLWVVIYQMQHNMQHNMIGQNTARKLFFIGKKKRGNIEKKKNKKQKTKNRLNLLPYQKAYPETIQVFK